MTTPPPESGRTRRPRWVAWAGFVIGIGLLAWAVKIVISSDPDAFVSAFERLRGAPWWAGTLVFGGPLLNWLLVSTCLWMLLRRHGAIGLGEMQALVGSAWLLNHLPMRAGLVGRVGYHKLVNGIRVRDAIGATIWSIALAGVSGVMAFVLAMSIPPGSGMAVILAALIGPVMITAGLAMMVRALGRANQALLLAALSARYADLAVWACRYAVVFWVMGLEVSPVQIVAVTAVSQIAQLVPSAGAGLGIREWVVGLTAGAMGQAFDAGLAADLVNRACETILVIPVGLFCTTIVARRVDRFRRGRGVEPGTGAT